MQFLRKNTTKFCLATRGEDLENTCIFSITVGLLLGKYTVFFADCLDSPSVPPAAPKKTEKKKRVIENVKKYLAT